jgi:hypothetical protein
VRPRIRLDKHLALKFLLIQHAALRYQQQLLDGIGKLIRPALGVITQENPAENAPEGDIEAICQAWLDWGARRGLVR